MANPIGKERLNALKIKFEAEAQRNQVESPRKPSSATQMKASTTAKILTENPSINAAVRKETDTLQTTSNCLGSIKTDAAESKAATKEVKSVSRKILVAVQQGSMSPTSVRDNTATRLSSGEDKISDPEKVGSLRRTNIQGTPEGKAADTSQLKTLQIQETSKALLGIENNTTSTGPRAELKSSIGSRNGSAAKEAPYLFLPKTKSPQLTTSLSIRELAARQVQEAEDSMSPCPWKKTGLPTEKANVIASIRANKATKDLKADIRRIAENNKTMFREGLPVIPAKRRAVLRHGTTTPSPYSSAANATPSVFIKDIEETDSGYENKVPRVPAKKRPVSLERTWETCTANKEMKASSLSSIAQETEGPKPTQKPNDGTPALGDTNNAEGRDLERENALSQQRHSNDRDLVLRFNIDGNVKALEEKLYQSLLEDVKRPVGSGGRDLLGKVGRSSSEPNPLGLPTVLRSPLDTFKYWNSVRETLETKHDEVDDALKEAEANAAFFQVH
ncbi:hypothetical protein BP5796_04465 [Coleophoma crateriformis]|uniref:Uncharacterized protein n=1 Tax=Coleophoma crateriformis TaxID=565419 RepID=A0A3D8SA43_9HELO|nr:hypothetical protein BP5796_04465 [Coleophoma crateriformis]